MRKSYIFIGWGSVFLFGFLLWLSINAYANYVDVTGFCRIKITGDLLRGNEDTIKVALRFIKKSDKKAYREVCQYVDVITERYCVDADYHLDQPAVQASWERAGCFIQGSKTIYLKPDSVVSEDLIKGRAKEIMKDALLSKKYWEGVRE